MVICTRLFFGCKSKGRFTRLQERSVGSSKGKGYSFVKKIKKTKEELWLMLLNTTT